MNTKRMDLFDAVKSRRSVRTFDGAGLNPELAEKILNFAKTATNPYNLPIEWKLLSAKEDKLTSNVIVGADTYLAGKMKQEPYAEEAFGYSLEKIVLYAQALGIGTTIIAGTMDRGAFEKAVDLTEGEVMPCVTPLGVPAKKMSMRETLMRKGIKADVRFPFEELFFDGDFEKPLTKEAAGVLVTPLEMVRLAPSAVNKQPWRAVLDGDKVHFYEKRSKGYINESGWDLQKVDMGIALCHLTCSLDEFGLTATLEHCEPKLYVPQDTEYIISCRVR